MQLDNIRDWALLAGLLASGLCVPGESRLWLLGAAGFLLLQSVGGTGCPLWQRAGLFCGAASYPLILVYLAQSGQPGLRLERPLLRGGLPGWAVLPVMALWAFGCIAALALCREQGKALSGRSPAVRLSGELAPLGWLCAGMTAAFALCLLGGCLTLAFSQTVWTQSTSLLGFSVPVRGTAVCVAGGWIELARRLALLAFGGVLFRQTALVRRAERLQRAEAVRR